MASDEYRVGHILLGVEDSSPRATAAAERQAERIVTELRDGADFATMAVKNSSASTALEGGDLGWRAVDQLPSLFGEVVLEMEVGDVSDPIRNALGFHVVKLISKRGASTQSSEKTNVRPHTCARHPPSKPTKKRVSKSSSCTKLFRKAVTLQSCQPNIRTMSGQRLLEATSAGPMARIWIPRSESVWMKTEVGELSKPFKSAFGWHVLEVLDRRVEDLSEEALDDLAFRSLHSRRYDEALQEWLKEIRDEAFVKIVEESS